MTLTDSLPSVAPQSLEELSAVIIGANESSQSLVPCGGRTALDIGNAGDQASRYLDITGFNAIRDFRPADLTLSVGAGMRIGELMRTLAEHGQELPIDVPHIESATVGGLVATGFAGPRRLGSGTLKDLILGCDYVRGDGLIAKAGGQVVKNVSGFEIPRLLHGSWGALAVLTSVNFKVTPKPKSEMTVSWQMDSTAAAIEAAHRVRRECASAHAIEVVVSPGTVTLMVRLMGRAGALESQIRDLASLFGLTQPILDEQSQQYWQSHCDRYGEESGSVQLVLSTRPRFIGEAVGLLLTRLGLQMDNVEAVVSPGIGVARVRCRPGEISADHLWSRADLPTLTESASLLVEFAPDDWKRTIDVWGPRPDGLDVMRAIKEQFDPNSVLNRDRLFI